MRTQLRAVGRSSHPLGCMYCTPPTHTTCRLKVVRVQTRTVTTDKGRWWPPPSLLSIRRPHVPPKWNHGCRNKWLRPHCTPTPFPHTHTRSHCFCIYFPIVFIQGQNFPANRLPTFPCPTPHPVFPPVLPARVLITRISTQYCTLYG